MTIVIGVVIGLTAVGVLLSWLCCGPGASRAAQASVGAPIFGEWWAAPWFLRIPLQHCIEL